MRKLNKFCNLFLIFSVLVLSVAAQTGKLPHFKKGEDYGKVRVKMLPVGSLFTRRTLTYV